MRGKALCVCVKSINRQWRLQIQLLDEDRLLNSKHSTTSIAHLHSYRREESTMMLVGGGIGRVIEFEKAQPATEHEVINIRLSISKKAISDSNYTFLPCRCSLCQTDEPTSSSSSRKKYITRRNDWRWKEIILLWFYYWKWQKLFKDQKWPNRMGEISAWIAFYRLSTLSLRNRFGLVCAAHTAVLIYTLSGTSENVSHAFALLIITQTKQHIRVRREVNKHRFDLYVKHKMPNHSDKIDRLPSLRPVVQYICVFLIFHCVLLQCCVRTVLNTQLIEWNDWYRCWVVS